MKRIVLFGLFAILLCSFATATFIDDTNDNAQSFYGYEDDEDDDVNSYDFTAVNTPTRVSSCIIGNCYDFDTGDGFSADTNLPDFDTWGNFSFSGWFNPDTDGVSAFLWTWYGNNQVAIQREADNTLYIYWHDGAWKSIDLTDQILASHGWQHLALSWNGTNLTVWQNATYRGESAPTSVTNFGGNDYVAGSSAPAYTWDGRIDAWGVFNYTMNQTHVDYLYASGSPTYAQQYVFGQGDNLTATLIYPTNGSSYFGNYNGSIVLSLSDVNGSATCSINDSRWTLNTSTPLLNGTVVFVNNTVITGENVSFSYACNDTESWSNGTGVFFMKYNVLNIHIYNADTGLYTNDSLVEVIIYNDFYYNSSFSTNNGTVQVSNLTNGSYTAIFSSVNYSTASYEFSQGHGDTTNLNVYLINSTNTVIFTITDYDNSQPIEGATVTIMKYVNDVLTVINVLQSDVTGRVQFYYDADTIYSFIVTYTGYDDKAFTLNPVVYSTYTIRLVSSRAVVDSSDFTGVNIYYTPKLFYDGLNTVTVTISEPSGSLSFYGSNISYPSGSNFTTGTNAYGEILTFNINISGAVFGDRLNITNYYRLDDGELRVFSYAHDIIPEPRNYTFAYNRDRTYGLGAFERGFISTLISVGAGGFASIFIGAVGGLAFALSIIGYLAYQGFISYWLLIIPFFGGVVFIIWRSSQ